MQINTIGLDLGKYAFQVHGVDGAGEVVTKRQLRRGQVLGFFAKLEPALVGMEACPTAHYWARAIAALGHEVRLMPPQYVKPYVKRNKNDMADAAAICEAVTRPSMRFVAIKTPEQQGALMLHRARNLLVRQRTMLVNALRGHLAEFGMAEPRGPAGVAKVVSLIEAEDAPLPRSARAALLPLAAQLAAAEQQLNELTASLLAWHRSNEISRRLATIPGIGPITASALAASVPDPGAFASGRQFAAWLGLVPRQNSTGGKPRLGRISKQGDGYLRRLLVGGAQSVLRWLQPRGAQPGSSRSSPWLLALLGRRPRTVVAVALANKMARIAWAVMTRNEDYRLPATAAAA